MSSETEWTVERALREGRADLLTWKGMEIQEVTRPDCDDKTLYRLAVRYLWQGDGYFFVDIGNDNDMRDLCLFQKCSTSPKFPFPVWQEPHYIKIGTHQPEPDGPPRDWPSIWRQQLREHVERAPMIPREYVDEALSAIDFHRAAKGISGILRNAKSGELKP